jgi:hypothetical protein
MTGDELGTVQDSHLGGAGHHRHRAAYVGVGDGVVVEVEAHVGGLADTDLLALIGGKGIVGQGQSVGVLLFERLAH